MGKELVAAAPTELSVGNMVRRILYIIREEYETEMAHESSQSAEGSVMQRHHPSLGIVLGGELSQVQNSSWTETMPVNFKQAINEAIKELVQEIEDTHDQVMLQLQEHCTDNNNCTRGFSSCTVSAAEATFFNTRARAAPSRRVQVQCCWLSARHLRDTKPFPPAKRRPCLDKQGSTAAFFEHK